MLYFPHADIEKEKALSRLREDTVELMPKTHASSRHKEQVLDSGSDESDVLYDTANL